MDTDVFYRKPAPFMRAVFVDAVGAFFDACQRWSWALAQRLSAALANPSDWIPGGLERIPEDEQGYDEDRNRRPLGVSVALTLIVFVFVSVWALRSGAS